jgi:hypothetical protein
MRTRSCTAALASLALIAGLAACAVGIPELLDSSSSDRFTYVVRYSLSGTLAATADVTYIDATGAPATVAAVSAGWSLELAPMSYDYGNLFLPSARVFNTSLNDGESLTLTISWKDYKVDFANQVLVERTVAITSGGPSPQDLTLFAPELPR